jgi:hypothetical protein
MRFLPLLVLLALTACIQPDADDAPAPPPDVIDGPDGLALIAR